MAFQQAVVSSAAFWLFITLKDIHFTSVHKELYNYNMPKVFLKEFPKSIVDDFIKYLDKKGYSYRDMKDIFDEVRGFKGPSLGYISKVLKKKTRAPGQAP